MSQSHPNVDSSDFKKKILSEVNAPLKGDGYNIQYGSTADDVPILESDSEKKSKCMKIYGVLVTMKIEPIIFCFMFGFIMNMTILTNLMMDIGCYKHLNYSFEICNNLSGYPDEKKKVEILATDYSLYSNLLSLVGAFIMVFIAPWSDKYGRKPPLLCAVVGVIVTDIGFILCTIYKTRLEYLLLARVPSEVFGGFICVLTIIYSHASEVSSEKNRTLKYTTIEIAMMLGIALGMLTGGFLYRYYGYFYVYITVASLHTFCLVWVAIVVEETTGLDIDVKWSEKAKKFFMLKSFKNGIEATFKAREGGKRALIVLLLLSMCVIILTYESFGSNGFVYVHHIYNWDATTYSLVTTTVQLIQLAITLFIVPLFITVFKFQDYTLGIIGATSMMAKNLILAFAKSHVYVFYLGQFAGLLSQFCLLAVRTSLSKLVEKDELGKVFSFLATCEAIIPMLGTIAVTKVFEATLDIYPNVTYGMTVIMLILPVITFIWGFIKSKKALALSVPAEDHTREKA